MPAARALANVFTGGAVGMAQGIHSGNPTAVATGGAYGGSNHGPQHGSHPSGQPAPEAQAYFNQQSPEDQQAIRQSWGPQQSPYGVANMMNRWYGNALLAQRSAQSVPPPAAVPPPIAGGPAAFSQPIDGVPGVGAPGGVANMLTGAFPADGGKPKAKPEDSGYSDPYEAWKAGGRVGPRPQ